MKQMFSLIVVLFCWMTSHTFGQTMTLTSPAMTPPYQVTSGTMVTFEWSAFGSPPTSLFTYSQNPTINSGLPPDPSWTQHTNYTPTGNGNYSITLPITANTWVFGGISGFIGWQYSNAIEVQVISNLSITASDSLICPTNGSVTFTAPTASGYSYQWYQDTTAISGATNSTYTTNLPGSFHCKINDGTTIHVSNTLVISTYTASFTGALLAGQIELTADQTYSSYQWFERSAGGTVTPIVGATNANYTAPITSNQILYSYEGTQNGCSVTSPERSVVDTFFTVPTLTLNATQNSQGYVCAGTPVSLSATPSSGSFEWFKNGQFLSTGSALYNIYGASQNGAWHVERSSTEWPEISVQSNVENVSIYQLINPDITGANYYNYFCPGDVIPLILTDEGYNYTWYLHDTATVYNTSHIISVPNGYYQHNFTHTQWVTVVASYNGCSVSKSIKLKSITDKTVSINIDNYDQQYLCTDSTATLFVPSWQAIDYSSFQWYKQLNGNWSSINGQTNSALTVSDSGVYKVEATPISCASVTVSSSPYTIHHYTDRVPSIWTQDDRICSGETTTLNLSGASSWYAMQWLNADITIGNGGYSYQFVGMPTNSAADTQNVTEYGTYLVSAKHVSCPNGLKVKSNWIQIKPQTNSKIELVTPFPSEPKHIVAWDSTEHYIGCTGEPVQLTLSNQNYLTIQWYESAYTGDDDYILGTQIGTSDTVATTMDAKWIAALVTDSNACASQTTPVLLDSRVFQSPAIASYNNSELCDENDSTLLHIAFQGTWISYQWYLDGIALPNTNNDSLWARDTGEYTLSAFPADCPTMEFSSGIGPVVKMLYAEILENDTLLYAMPELGYYTYQWYFNGTPVNPPNPNLPWIFPKNSLQNGIYTVEVSNDNCTKLSAEYVWNTTGIQEIKYSPINLYPNPTKGILNIETQNGDQLSAAVLMDMNGRIVQQFNLNGQTQIDISDLDNGIYIFQIIRKDLSSVPIKISKN